METFHRRVKETVDEAVVLRRPHGQEGSNRRFDFRRAHHVELHDLAMGVIEQVRVALGQRSGGEQYPTRSTPAAVAVGTRGEWWCVSQGLGWCGIDQPQRPSNSSNRESLFTLTTY